MKRCPKCGKEFPDERNFCSVDGTQLVPVPEEPANPATIMMMRCPTCGAVYDSSKKFCLKDGTALVPQMMPVASGDNPSDQPTGNVNPYPGVDHSGTPADNNDRSADRSRLPVIVVAVCILAAAAVAGFFAFHFVSSWRTDREENNLMASAADSQYATEDSDMSAMGGSADAAMTEDATAESADTEDTAAVAESAATVDTEDTSEEAAASESSDESASEETTDESASDEATEASTEAATEEPEPEPQLLNALDPDDLDDLMNSGAKGADYAIAVMNMDGDEIVGTSQMDDPMSSSVILDIPILYTAEKMIEDGSLSLDTKVKFTVSASGRGRLGKSDNGKKFRLEDLITDMLQYSDNNATNSLLDYFGYDKINNTCKDDGYHSVSIVNQIGHTEDNTSNDNYLSASDTAGMIRYLYNCDGPINKEFLDEYMQIEDSQARKGLGKNIGSKVTFHNLNGIKDSKFNEAALIEDDDRNYAYVIVYLANGRSLDILQKAAADIGDHVNEAVAGSEYVQSESQ